MNKYLIIVNPTAGRGFAGKSLQYLKDEAEKSGINYTLFLTESPGHATNLVKEHQSQNDVIISVGGDGTLNEVINGIDFYKNPTFGVLPVGSGNDFSTNINFKKDYLENLKILFNNNQKIIVADVGYYSVKSDTMDHSGYFLNGIGIGFDAYVAFINQNEKIFSGISSYIYAVLKSLRYFNSFEADIKLNGQFVKIPKMFLYAIGNGHSSGGGFYLTPGAQIDDALLNTCLVHDITKPKILRKLPYALINKMENVKEANLDKTKSVEIFIKNSNYIHTDGEAFVTGPNAKIHIELLPGKLKVISA
ncbi:MAG: diacylglycerol kinase family lipid kinase [Melioribacteraceae bacterium]|nr:diacylglycerol kinase family lipid kinase [Melioribacteraceae bacterium]MDD3558176.1 diacylglycerol kinase family lipid kinase [Melioribacteraceae bacterium]